jgi:two-component system, OmpR family, sensor histidine kinase KdpD
MLLPLFFGTMLVILALSALLLRQQRQARAAQAQTAQEAQLRCWSDELREATDNADDIAAHAQALRDVLNKAAGTSVTVMARRSLQENSSDEAALVQVGQADAEQLAGLQLCLQLGQALGPGCARDQAQPHLYLPLRGRGVVLGAALLHSAQAQASRAAWRESAQALCDLSGQAMQRWSMAFGEQQARETAREQGLRNALLAAISHDYRTPLASIMGAASALDQQADRLSVQQRQKLAAGIVEEVQRLSRLTDNTLQLVRLDSPGVRLNCDWESAEELVGSTLRRVRRRPQGQRVRARLEPDLPLLWCDALLLSQLLDNLVDNALKYSPAETDVDIVVRQQPQHIVLGVRDRGPGIAPARRQRVFDVFQRGAHTSTDGARAGVGVGLAVCRAIARAHGGELSLRPRGRGGCSFECALPLLDAPAAAQESKHA